MFLQRSWTFENFIWIIVWWNTVSHTPWPFQLQALNDYTGLLQGQPPLGVLVGALVIASLCLVFSVNKGFYCAWMDNIENNKASGSDTVKPMATRATQTLVLSLELCLVLLLIAESWLEWGEGRLEVWTQGVYELRNWGRKRGMGQGLGRWWLIRDWTARSCLCTTQGSMSKQNYLPCLFFFASFLFCPSIFLSLILFSNHCQCLS